MSIPPVSYQESMCFFTEEESSERFLNYSRASEYLNALSDAELAILVAQATRVGSSATGLVFSTEVKGVPLFIKRLRLSAIEEENRGSTRNFFDLPLYYQYGVGSLGLGAWREVSAHTITTGWVRDGQCQNFPLMYHWRVLPRSAPPPLTEDQLEERKQYIAYWNGAPAIRDRLDAIDKGISDVVIFLEHFPENLHQWLREDPDLSKLATFEKELLSVTSFMQERGFLHFDPHFRNVLVKEDHVYFADFGLAISQEFDLSEEERAFFEKHRDYDRSCVAAELLRGVVVAAFGEESAESILNNFLLKGIPSEQLPSTIRAVAQRCGPIFSLMGKFFYALREESKSTPYPEKELALAWSSAGLKP